MSNLNRQIAEELVRKFPDTPSRTLSTMLYRDNKECFTSTEHARTMIRRARGAQGDKGAKFPLPNPSKLNPFDSIPDGLRAYDDWSNYDIEGKSVLVLADSHIPYHDKLALKLALEFGLDKQIDTIVLLGDFADFFSVSFWEKDPRKRDFTQDITTVQNVLKLIRAAYPSAKIIYKIGNHEERLERYLRVKAPELLGYSYLSYSKLFDPDGTIGINIVQDKRILKLDHLNLVHGHEFGRSVFSPVNPARGVYLRGKAISLSAHNHQTSQHTEKDMNGGIVSCWSIGCLCDLRPEYMPINKWNHGFAHVVNRPDGFIVNNLKIINGKVF